MGCWEKGGGVPLEPVVEGSRAARASSKVSLRVVGSRRSCLSVGTGMERCQGGKGERRSKGKGGMHKLETGPRIRSVGAGDDGCIATRQRDEGGDGRWVKFGYERPEDGMGASGSSWLDTLQSPQGGTGKHRVSLEPLPQANVGLDFPAGRENIRRKALVSRCRGSGAGAGGGDGTAVALACVPGTGRALAL